MYFHRVRFVCKSNLTPSCFRVCGSYSDMHAGTPEEAMMDFTGGFHMHVELSQPRSDLFELMFKAGESRSLMGCGTYQVSTIKLFFCFCKLCSYFLGSISIKETKITVQVTNSQNSKHTSSPRRSSSFTYFYSGFQNGE